MREAMRKGGDTTATAKTAELWRSAPSAEIQRARTTGGEAQAEKHRRQRQQRHEQQ